MSLKKCLVHASATLREVKSTISEIRGLYNLERDPLYKGVADSLNKLARDLRRANELATKAETLRETREKPIVNPRSFRPGTQVFHPPSGEYATVLKVDGVKLNVAWLDSLDNTRTAILSSLECRRVTS